MLVSAYDAETPLEAPKNLGFQVANTWPKKITATGKGW